MRQAMTILASLLLLSIPPVCIAQDGRENDSRIIWIGLANGLEVESVMASELRELIRKYDVEPWVLTRTILIDRGQIPHSHPILTIHTRHVGEELALLSTFVHEQLHWIEEKPRLEDFQAAMSEFENIFPEVPSSTDGGARDAESTYRHLLVCDMELQVMTTLVGQASARQTLAQNTHYDWIYDKVLNDQRVREVVLRHGFNVSQGIST
jgi:hypothetical protein